MSALPSHPSGEQLSAWIDGELVPFEAERVERHVRECAACSGLADELRQVDRWVADSEPPPLPVGYFDTFAERVVRRLPERTPSRPRVVPWVVATAAAAVLAAVVAPVLLREGAAPPRTTAEAPGPTAREPRARDDAPALEDRPAEAAPAPRLEKAAPASGASRPPAPAPVARPPVAPLQREQASTGEGRRDRESRPPRRDPAPPAAPAAPPAELAESVAAPLAAGATAHDEAPAAEAEEVREADEADASPQAKSADRLGMSTERAGRARPSQRSTFAPPPMPATADEARRLREWWRSRAAESSGADSDEARVRVIEMGAQAYRLDRQPADLARLREDLAAYLDGAGGRQPERARRAVEGLLP